jgi:hypothetical protein
MAIEGIIGRKIGMTQVYAEDGRAIPATVLQAGPCVVVQRKTKQTRMATRKNKKTGHTSTRQVTDGYEAVQLGLVEDRKVKKVTKAQAGHFKKTGGDLPPVKVLRELRVKDGDEAKVGDKVSRRATSSTSSAPARARASRAWSSATTSAGARPPTGRCSTARPAPSALRPSRAACSRACAPPATWARTA